jgi:hypothetical protein
MIRTLGQWNAFVEAGESILDRRARLAEVPDDIRESVRAHVATVFLLREAARLKGQDTTSMGSRPGGQDPERQSHDQAK